VTSENIVIKKLYYYLTPPPFSNWYNINNW